MRNWRNQISTILTFFFLILFVWFYTGITMFYHIHRLYGSTIVHSHPDYSSKKSKGSESHSHSPEAYNLIHEIDSLDWVNDLYIPEPPEPVVEIVTYYITKEVVRIIDNSKEVISLRAPPFSISSVSFC